MRRGIGMFVFLLLFFACAQAQPEDKREQVAVYGIDSDTAEKIDGISLDERSAFCADVRIGYLKGRTAYEFDHHTSELIFPMDNLMAGIGASYEEEIFSLNGEFWFPLEDDAGNDMIDRDWDSDGFLMLESVSNATIDAMIADGNLRYDFFRRRLLEDVRVLSLEEGDSVRVGGLAGFRYERYNYDLYNLYYKDVPDYISSVENQLLYPGTRVLTYRIDYYIPYVGVAFDVDRTGWSVGGSLKYSPYPLAYDKDNHLMRGLTFYGEYDQGGSAWILDLKSSLELNPSWKLKAGGELEFVRIDGTTYEEARSPAWDKDQFTDMKHWTWWAGVEYRF